MIQESTRYTDTLWCVCGNEEEYRNFARELWLYDKRRNSFGGEQFDYKGRWVKHVLDWMFLFGIPDDLTSDEEYAVDDPLTYDGEMNEKPEYQEYPVVVRVEDMDGDLYIDWFSLPKSYKVQKEYSDSTLMNMNKSELVNWIQCLTKNVNSQQWRINNQYQVLLGLEEKIKQYQGNEEKYIARIQRLENQIEDNTDAYNKQIAKSVKELKIYTDTSGYKYLLSANCPNCDKNLGVLYDYCPSCGQHLEWNVKGTDVGDEGEESGNEGNN